jgi:single-strand DNA-binding protein
MSKVNKVILMGNLTRNPELKTLPSGNRVCEFGLAMNRSFTTQSGDQREETTFVELSAFGRSGEVIEQYCQKGSPLFVEGRLRFDSWQNDQGEKRSKLSVIVENFQLMPDAKREPGRNTSPSPVAPVGGHISVGLPEDDDPF